MLLGYFVLVKKLEYAIYYLIVLYISVVFARSVTVDIPVFAVIRDAAVFLVTFLLFYKTLSMKKIDKALITDRFSVLFMVFILWFLVVMLVQLEDALKYALIYREYVSGLLLYFVFLLFFIFYGDDKFKNIIWVILWTFFIISVVTLLVYFQVLNIGKFVYAGGVERFEHEARIIGGLLIPRLTGLLGISAGGFGLINAILVITALLMKRTESSKSMILNMFVLTFFISGVLSVSFTFFLTIGLFILIRAFYTIKMYKLKLIIAILSPVILIVLLNFIELQVGDRDLNLYDYAEYMLNSYFNRYFELGVFEVFFGHYIDVKTSLVDRAGSRDDGIFAIFTSTGIVGSIIFLSLMAIAVYRFYVLNKIKTNDNLLSIAFAFAFAPLLFLHGFGMTSEPLDLFMMIGLSYMTFSYVKIRRENVKY
jgi:hypothetical protein